MENREADLGQTDEYRTRYGRTVVRPQWWLECKEQEGASRVGRRAAMSCIAKESTADSNFKNDKIRNTDHFIMLAIIGDVMNLQQVLKQPDKEAS